MNDTIKQTGHRQARALAVFERAGIDLANSKPDSGPRRWFAGPSSPTIRGLRELELVAYHLGLADSLTEELVSVYAADIDRLVECSEGHWYSVGEHVRGTTPASGIHALAPTATAASAAGFHWKP